MNEPDNKPRLPMLCTNCHQGHPGIEGPCGYREEIHEDSTPCEYNCCRECRYECAQDI